MINEDVLHKVAEFVPPNVATYCRLATVNRTFYAVFTSDRLWHRLDVYGKGRDIFGTFQSALKESSTKVLRDFYFSAETQQLLPSRVMAITRNRFAWLAFMCGKPRHSGYFAIYKSLLKVAVVLVALHDPSSFKELQLREDDVELACLALKTNPQVFEFLEEEKFGHQNEFMKLAASLAPTNIDDPVLCIYNPPGDRPDFEIEAAAIKHDIRNIAHASDVIADPYYADYDLALSAAKLYPGVLTRVTPLNDNKQFIMEVFQAYTEFDCYEEDQPDYYRLEIRVLDRVSERLQEDYDVCSLALKVHPLNIRYVRCYDPKLLSEVPFENFHGCDKRLDGYTEYFRRYPFEQCYDEQLCELLIEYLPDFYWDLPLSMRLNRRLALLACVEGGYFAVVPDMLKRDPTFWIECISRIRYPLDCLYVPMLYNENVARAAIERGCHPLLLDQRLNTDYARAPDLILKYIRSGGMIPEDKMPSWVCDDGDMMLRLVEECGCYLRLASEDLSNYEEIVRAAFGPHKSKICIPYRLLSKETRDNSGLMLSLAEKCGLAPRDWYSGKGKVPEQFDCTESLLKAVALDPTFYRWAPEHLRSSVAFNVEVVGANPLVLNYMEDEMAAEPQVIRAVEFGREKKETLTLCATCRKYT